MIQINNQIKNWLSGAPWYCSYNRGYLFSHPWIIVRELFFQVKWAYQRIFRGWDDRVLWSLDLYLAENIPEWIKHIKNECDEGLPACMFTEGDYIKNGLFWELYLGVWEKARGRRNAILNKIVEGFEEYVKIANWDYDFKSKEYKDARQKYNDAFYLLHEYFETLWD
jgi:hypothetical protein